jgi:hypothetical protein
LSGQAIGETQFDDRMAAWNFPLLENLVFAQGCGEFLTHLAILLINLGVFLDD